MKKLKTAVVGLNWGNSVIRSHLVSGEGARFLELAGICSREPELTAQLAAEYGVRVYRDLDEILADPTIEAVCLMTGPAGRAALIQKIIEAGKDVMTTKPIEVDPEAALAVLRRAKELGRIVHLNSPSPLPSPDLAQIEKWRTELGLGRPIAVRAEIWSSYREQKDGKWYDDPALCPVAPIFRLGIYLINDLVRLIGRPKAVSVMSSRIFTGRPTADNAQLGLLFEDGTLATIFASFCVNDAQWWLSSLTLNYENGTVYRNVRPSLSPTPREKPELQVVVNAEGKASSTFHIASASNEDYQWETFYNAVTKGPTEDEMKPEDMVYALRVIQAMARAEKSGRIEPVTP